MRYITIINNEQFEIEIDNQGGITLNGETREVDFFPLGTSLYSVITDDASWQVVVEEEQDQIAILMGGHMYETKVLDERALLMAQRRGGLGGGSGELNAPMPGLIVKIVVQAGDTVHQGQTVVILESMKMQNELKSPVDGVIESVYVEDGQTVDKNAKLVVISPVEK